MANEAILLYETGPAIPVNVIDANGLEKGAVLQMEDNFVAKDSTGVDQIFGGITKYEKIALDTTLKVACYFEGWFKMVVGTNGCTVGCQVVFDDATNTITDYDASDNEVGKVIGRVYQTATVGQTAVVHVGGK